jgi:uncharacterized protein
MERTGRNDPCSCGSGKKYKLCCLLKKQKDATPQGLRKFTAKVISSGGVAKPVQPEGDTTQQQQRQAVVDYNVLMERSFGSAISSTESKPPLPENPLDYLADTEKR